MKYCLPTSDLLSKFAIFTKSLSLDNYLKFIFLLEYPNSQKAI